MLDKPSENIDPIEDLFRKRFQEHEVMPPSGVWDAISESRSHPAQRSQYFADSIIRGWATCRVAATPL